ncbi:aldehyde dehydrogenase family protein [Acidicapsa ligni]|uniref:aldehyde dehydrogenase family protein n=1 Tax=Acidicapsa ligni TaxID=542300 RepID=UPI0021E0858C|nr:aldehyde dehydrogenase family protein [Acidicapsa ligni]
MDVAEILIDGKWQAADVDATFHAENPATGETLATAFPISRWSDCDAALSAASKAAVTLREVAPERLAAFLEEYASNIEAAAPAIIAAANEETGLAVSPRLKDVELPRTTNQLRQAAAAAREESWKRATLDLERNIRSCFVPIGPVVVFGPNNFPLAFNGISGGDFAAAIAAGNPVIAKAHPLHPNTTRLLAEEARKAASTAGLPSGTVQMIYNVRNADGLKLVSDPRVGAVGFTGSRGAGLALKHAADEAGKAIYLEMSSLNPVIFLPGAIAERGEQLGRELIDSCLAGSGQFCTSPNLILLWEGEPAESFVAQVAKGFSERTPQPLLSSSGREHIREGVAALIHAGARLAAGGSVSNGSGYRFENTLLRATGAQFLANPSGLQREVFGNATLVVTVSNEEQLQSILQILEGNLTGTIYSAKTSDDDAIYSRIEPLLLAKVGRLLNDKMPTGVAVSPAMQHGGPFPATSHPGFTSVGIPASLTRFAQLRCYDGVREDRLPEILRNSIENPQTWRSIGGEWVKG